MKKKFNKTFWAQNRTGDLTDYTGILNHWATHVLVIFNHLYIIRMPNPLPFHPKFSTLITPPHQIGPCWFHPPSQFSTNPSTPRNPLVIFPERPPPLTLILANPIDTWPGEKRATRLLAVLPGDRDMTATPPSNTAGDHGGPAHGDAGNKRFKKPHRRHAHPQGLTDDYELSFQPNEPSRYATLLAISHLLLPRVCLNSFRELL